MTEEIKGQPKCHPLNEGGEVLLDKLKKEGWNPQVCDAEFSYMPQDDDDGFGCAAHESFEERLMLPPEVLPLFPMTGISMIDDSMSAAGIRKGDILIMVYDDDPDDGNVVLASVAGKQMVRFYYEDDEGNKWLLSKNEGVEPICISDRDDTKLLARIMRYISNAPSLKYSEANKLTKDAKRLVKKPKVASLEHAQWVIKQLGPDVKIIRDWFSFYRPLVQYHVVDDKDYKGFCKIIKEALPDHTPQPKYDEIQRLDDGCFRKPVEEWTPISSPYKNFNRFYACRNRAMQVISFLELEESHEDLTKTHEKMA